MESLDGTRGICKCGNKPINSCFKVVLFSLCYCVGPACGYHFAKFWWVLLDSAVLYTFSTSPCVPKFHHGNVCCMIAEHSEDSLWSKNLIYVYWRVYLFSWLVSQLSSIYLSCTCQQKQSLYTGTCVCNKNDCSSFHTVCCCSVT